jgi:hypothetical protein
MPFFDRFQDGQCAVFIPLTPLRQTQQIQSNGHSAGAAFRADEAIGSIDCILCEGGTAGIVHFHSKIPKRFDRDPPFSRCCDFDLVPCFHSTPAHPQSSPVVSSQCASGTAGQCVCPANTHLDTASGSCVANSE